MNIEQKQIIDKFEEIKHNDGLILIEHIINSSPDNDLIKDIISSLSKNKNKYTYEIYDYVIKNGAEPDLRPSINYYLLNSCVIS